MDGLLRACAKTRREQAGPPFELHPATRRMLQSEVARLATRPASGGKSWSFLSPEGLFFSGALLAGFTVCAAILLQQQVPLIPANLVTSSNAPLPFSEKTAPELLPPPGAGNQLAYESRSLEDGRDVDLPTPAIDNDKPAINSELFQKPISERSWSLAINRSDDSGGNIILGGNTSDLAAIPARDRLTMGGGEAQITISPRPLAGVTSDTFTGGLTAEGGALSVNRLAATPSPPGNETNLLAKDVPPTPAIAPQADLLAARDANASTAESPAHSPTAGKFLVAKSDVDASTAENPAQAPVSAAMPQSSQQFFAVGGGARAKPQEILTTFEMRVDGDLIRLIDSDGSIYEGKIERAKMQQYQQLTIAKGQKFSNTVAPGGELARAGAAEKSLDMISSGVTAGFSNSMQSPVRRQMLLQQAGQQQSQNLFFRASGTSRSLGQVVTFEGACIAATAEQSEQSKKTRNLFGVEMKNVDEKETRGGASSTLRIQGEAQIGNGPKIEIDAVPLQMKAKAMSQ
jgi:hypothetical protein